MTPGFVLQSFQIASVVWRESFEALLVIGILLAWSAHEGAAVRRLAISSIATGVAVGFALAAGLAFLMTSAVGFLDGDGGDYLQMSMAAVAALLMLRMVFWMHDMARAASANVRAEAAAHAKSGNWVALAFLSAMAIAREGAETVVFLFGMLSGAAPKDWAAIGGSALVGAGVAAATFWALRQGASAMSKKIVAAASEALLLVLGSGLTMTAVDKAISLNLVSTMTAPLWNTRWLLDDTSGVGAFISGLAGYRAQPELLPLLALGFYWLAASLAYAPPFDDKATA